ncbi:hypothetical protein ACFW9F_01180 [Streptomyces sp. NPDC059506]|uniref:hypothetical protein n=1 Tax=Streptomyces sp. NPDC059506 TaxID=3347751 RepID=UPI0036B53E4A
MAVLLYHPLVNPPAEVVHQALLYWDGISSVVPRALPASGRRPPSRTPEPALDLLRPDLRDLRDRGLYSPLVVDPDLLYPLHHRPEACTPDEPDPTWVILEDGLRRMAGSGTPPRPPASPGHFIIPMKTHWRLEELLCELGLAEEVQRPDLPEGYALSVAEEVQQFVVGTVVRGIADDASRSGTAHFPYTDREEAHRWALRPSPAGRPVLSWEMELGRLLPLPAPGTPTAEVLAFRERHRDERLRLMRALHRMLGDLRRDYEHPADVLARLRHEIDQAVGDYRAAVRASRTAWVSRSVTVAVALGAAGAGAHLAPGLEWVLGTVGGYTLNVATREIRPAAKEAREHDFSYLHRVGASLGEPPPARHGLLHRAVRALPFPRPRR